MATGNLIREIDTNDIGGKVIFSTEELNGSSDPRYAMTIDEIVTTLYKLSLNLQVPIYCGDGTTNKPANPPVGSMYIKIES